MLQSAEMKIPDHIQTIATVDRAKPAKNFNNILEGFVSGEDIGADRTGRMAAIDELASTLTRTPRFQVKSTGIELTGSKSGSRMEPPLPWSEIERLAKQYNVDAIITLEKFDSNRRVNVRDFDETYKEDGVKKTRTVYEADMDMNVETGWRLYDVKKHIIIDEWNARAGKHFKKEGKSKKQAESYLPSYRRIVEDLGREAATIYAMRIAPIWVTVDRQFYTSGKGEYKDAMKKAAKWAKADNWNKAIEIWRNIVEKADTKTAGRAAHNLAVAAERLGHLDLAIEWAQRAAAEFGNSKSKRYVRTLQMRKENDKRAQYQLSVPDKA